MNLQLLYICAVLPDLRKKENLHIVFWLIKDFSWLMHFRAIGVAMAVPTFVLAIWLSWKSRADRADLFHNIAITCWIVANSIWMCGEFFCDDCPEMRIAAQPFFILGFSFLVYFYVTEYFKNRAKPTA